MRNSSLILILFSTVLVAQPSFSAADIATNISAASSVHSADMDGDGDMDILATSESGDKVYWFENNGNADPSFSANVIASSIDGAWTVFPADMDNDGDIDVFSGSQVGNKVTIHYNDGAADPSFSSTVIGSGAYDVRSVFVADLDNDGDMDAIYGSGDSDDELVWLRRDSDGSFAGMLIYSADNIRAVYAADLDSDGDMDIISASEGDDKLQWAEHISINANGSINYTERTIATGLSDPMALNVNDVDADGDLDILLGTQGDDKIIFYESDGAADPSFSATTITSSADGIYSVYAKDMDNDGDLDILSASANDDKIAWYESNGAADPSFTARTIATSADGAASVFAADLDGDGDQDVISASLDDNTVAWYENGLSAFGSHSFTAADIATSADGAIAVFVADLDNDGDKDIVSAGFNDDAIAWYENDGAANPSFSAADIATSADGATFAFAADMDNDGDMDIVSTSTIDHTIAWYENDGAADPSWTAADIATDALYATDLFVADMDNDGDMDIVSASAADNTIAWYENDGAANPSWTAADIATSAQAAFSVFVADMDNDGDMDILSASRDDDAIAWYENDGAADPSWTAADIATSADGAASVFAADMDNDGDMDIVSASLYDDAIAWYENNGAADPSWTAADIATSADGARCVFAADMDNDGDMDILTVSANDDQVRWYENDGAVNPSWTAITISSAADYVEGLYQADLDNDGDIDVISASYSDDKLAWYENDGAADPSFTANSITTSADQAVSVFAIDIDRDGDMDLVSASSNDDKIAWYENDGAADPSFTTRSIATSADYAKAVFAADMDNDGDIDIISGSYNDDAIAWYENTSTAGGITAWTAATISTNSDEPHSVDAADVDGDGDMDVLSASFNDNKLVWYENNGSQNFIFSSRLTY